MFFSKTYKLILSEIDRSLSGIIETEVDSLNEGILKAKKIFVIGAGRMGLILKTFCMRLNHLGFDAFVVGSVTSPPIFSEDLLIVASSSGKTASNLAMVEKASYYNAKIFTITADLDSPIAKLSTKCLFLKGPSSLYDSNINKAFSEQPMKALFEQSLLILLDSILLMLMQKTGQNIDDISKRHANLE